MGAAILVFMRRLRPGARGWIATAAFITVVDWWLIRHNHDTLSTVFGESLHHPLQRWPVMVTWAVITIHLFSGLLPVRWRHRMRKLDPLGLLARLMEKTRIVVDEKLPGG